MVEMLDGTIHRGTLTLQPDQTLSIQGQGGQTRLKLSALRRAVWNEPPSPEKIFDLRAKSAPLSISTEAGVPLSQSAQDAINGIVGIFDRPGGGKEWQRAYLTDATSDNAPADQPGWFAGTVTWDLGPEIPPAQRQLDALSVWIWGGDHSRCDYAGSLAVSVDGQQFIEIPGARTEVDFGRIGSREKTFNCVHYALPPGRVVNFRYLRLIAETPPTGADTRFVEVDAFVSRVERDAAQVSRIVARSGSELAGTILKADGTTLVLEWGGREWSFPQATVARILYYRLGPETLRLMPPGKKGAVLSTGDFLEGALSRIEGQRIKINSVLFGLKSLEAAQEALGLALSDVEKAPARYRVRTTDGSTLLTDSIQVQADVLTVEEPSLGTLRVNLKDLAEISAGDGLAGPVRRK